MPSFRTGTVTTIVSERPGIQRVDVDGEHAYVLTQLIGAVAIGDEVVINTTAVDLGLGTGGSHVVHWNLRRRSFRSEHQGHVLKLRYTSEQSDVGVAEEEDPGLADGILDGTPVVVCGLHSQVAVAIAAVKYTNPEARVVFVMTDSAALPIALSDSAARLCEAGLLEGTVTTGQAFGGDDESVNLHSGLLVAVNKAHANVIVVGPGPGVVGTGSHYGFGPLDLGASVDAVNDLEGDPIVALRWSDADERERHRGLSHHVVTALTDACHTVGTLAVPTDRAHDTIEIGSHHVELATVPELADVLKPLGEYAATMGRAWNQDPTFFSFSAAAGVIAANRLATRRLDA